jgi:hypothetical protein
MPRQIFYLILNSSRVMVLAVALRRSEAGWHIITEQQNSRFRNTYGLFSGVRYRGRRPVHRVPLVLKAILGGIFPYFFSS